MDAVNRTLLSTQNLLCSLEQDASMLDDTRFMEKLAYLRRKHRQTTEYLSEIAVDNVTNKNLKKTYHLNTGCTHYWNELYAHEPLPHDYYHTSPNREAMQTRESMPTKPAAPPIRHTTSGRPSRLASISGKPQSATAAPRKHLVDKSTSPLKKSASLWNLDGKVRKEAIPEKPKEKPTATKLQVTKTVVKPLQEQIKPADPPKPTVPQPFKFASRRTTGNTYSQKFVQELLRKKEEEEKESEELETKKEPFRAHPVPSTTYSSSNPLMHDKKYVNYLQRKIQGNLERNFVMRRSKSDINVTAVRGSIPTSTYLPPRSRQNERSKSANRRAVDMLKKAHTPPGLKEHEFQTNIAFHLRHGACSKSDVKPAAHRVGMPDFKRIHAELNDKMTASMTHKQPTVPIPFNLSESNTKKHRNCLSASPPRRPARRISPSILDEDKAIPVTHAWKLRTSATRSKLEKMDKQERAGEQFREERADITEINRKRLKTMIKSMENINWQDRVDTKRREIAEATREYKKGLEEMKQRVLSRPLIMQLQSSLVHKHALEKKYQETMKTIGRTRDTEIEPIEREDSNGSAGTFLVESKRGSKDKGESSFLSENLNTDGEKLLSKDGSTFSVVSSKSSSSKSSASSSVRSSHRSSNSSSSSGSSGSRSTGRSSQSSGSKRSS